MRESSAIGFLVINRNDDLPKLSILSALKTTSSNVYVGYVDEQHILDIPNNPRVKRLKLDSAIVGIDESQNSYMDFSTLEFYKIVQLKWQLIEALVELDYDFITYSDFDVVWINNPIPALQKTLESNLEIHILLQSFTTDPSEVRLCMGFVVFRNSKVSKDFLSSARKLHANLHLENSFIGDDDVVTKLYRDLNQPRWIRELPQSTFPVGSLLNLFSKKNTFPGLAAPKPYIFHANYVVGLMNKRILSYLILRRYGGISASKIYVYFRWLVSLKRLKFGIISLSKKLFVN